MMKPRVWIWIAAAPLLFSLLICLVILLWFNAKEARIKTLWEKTLGPMDQVPVRYPSIPRNRSAQELEKLAAGLWIDMVPRHTKTEPYASKEDQAKYDALKLSTYLDERIDQADHRGASPPVPLARYMTDHESQIQEIVKYILDSDTPQWESHVGRVMATLPNLKGILQLHRVLNLYALMQDDAGQFQEAQHALEASWKINQPLIKSPERISVWIAIAAAKIQAGVLRQIRDVNPSWEKKLQNPGYLQSDFQAEQVEVWHLKEIIGNWKHGKDFSEKVQFAFYQVSLLDYAEQKALAIANLQRRDLCSPKHEPSFEEVDLLFPWWNRVGAIAYDDPAVGWNKAAKLCIDFELTSIILKIHKFDEKQRKTRQDFESIVCPGKQWQYRISDNTGIISFSAKMDWIHTSKSGPSAPPLPVTHVDQLSN